MKSIKVAIGIVFILVVLLVVSFGLYHYGRHFLKSNNQTTQAINLSKIVPQAWVNFTATKDNFSADFPIFPGPTSGISKSGDLSIPYTIYDSVTNNKEEYFVAVYNIPTEYQFKTEANIKDLLNVLLNYYINGENGTIKNTTYSNFMGFVAQDATASAKINGEDFIITLKYFYVTGNTVYVLGADAPIKLSPDFTKFVNSFKLLQP